MEKIEILKTPDFLLGEGEMVRRIRSFDWSKTSLGDPEEWSPSLKNVVGLMLVNRFPMLLWWGEEYIQFYNDPYIPIPGLKHPAALGQTGKECWREIWDVLKPLVDTPFKGGPASWMEDIMLQINRNNFVEETHFIIAYSPVPDATAPNGIGGVLATVNEITDAVISKRQMETLKELGKNISATLSEDELYTKVTEVLNSNLLDIPFALIYKIENGGSFASLTASSGVDINHPELSHKIYLGNDDTDSADISVAVSKNIVVESEIAPGLRDLPTGAWDIKPTCVIHIPVKAANKKFPFAILTIGLNPYRKFDDAYRNFVTLLSDQVSLGVNNAIAYAEERKRAEALQELDKAKTIFFSNISHEFRTPLTLILGTIEEILNDADTIPKDKERITVTHRNAMRLLKLVNTLLDFSRIESGRQKASYALTDIISLTENLAGNFRSIIEKAGLRFIVKVDTNIQPIYVDKTMWEKIVFNLLSNAFKYTLEGSITLHLFSENDHVTLEVEDTGVGIPEKELPHMFERFHRVQNVTGRTYEGTGIGLSLIKEFVQLHGGTISVKCIETRGSTFKVTIPFGKDHLPAGQIFEIPEDFEDIISDAYIKEATSLIESQEKWVVLKKDLQQATILVVDDNPDMRRHLQSLLEKQFNVLTAANGAEALHKINAEKPSLVLSDIMMPVMDGIQLLKEIKNNKDTDRIPVLLLTARAGEESKIEGYETGADDYLVKPFSANELLSRVKAQIDLSKKRRHVEIQLKEFLMQAPAAIAVFEGPGHCLTIANHQFQNVFGKTESQLIGRSVQEIFPEAELSQRTNIYKQVFETGIAYEGKEVEIEFKRNHKIYTGYYDLNYTPWFDSNGKIKGVMSVGVEVTENVLTRKKIENFSAELEQKVAERTAQLENKNIELEDTQKKLEQRNIELSRSLNELEILFGKLKEQKLKDEQKDDFILMASHELKTPVTTINGYVQLLMDISASAKHTAGIDIALFESPLKTIHKQIAKLTSLISDLLDLSKIQTGQLDLHKTTFYLSELVSDVVKDIQYTTQHKIDLTVDSNDEVFADKDRIMQVVINFITNAVKYSPNANKIEIKVFKEANKSAAVTVKDFGIGIDKADHKKIFERFYRAEGRKEKTFPGFGIGLYIASDIIKRHGGRISVKSEKNKGAEFTFMLPLEKKNARPVGLERKDLK